jgi:glycosyltransferase involved in cell wall biosynthesis
MSTTKPLVSILIPAYNSEQWIAATIESALAQTWAHKEIVIVDDGSTDGTLAVARRFASETVRVVGQKNQGAAAARNAAFRLSQGDYIQWLDADDLLSPTKIEAQLRLIADGDDERVLLSSGWAFFRYRPSAARFEPTPLWEDLSPVEFVRRKWSYNLHMQTATWLVSRHLSEAGGLWDPTMLSDDDGEYFNRVVLSCRRIRFSQEARVYYRIVGTNRLSYIGDSHQKVDAHYRGMLVQIDQLRAVDDGPQVHAAIVKYLNTWLPIFYPEHPEFVERMRALARELGGELVVPSMGWKYAWIDALFGRVAAKRAKMRYNAGKTAVLRAFDKALHTVSPATR